MLLGVDQNSSCRDLCSEAFGKMLTSGCGGERGWRLASLHLLVIAFYKILHLQER